MAAKPSYSVMNWNKQNVPKTNMANYGQSFLPNQEIMIDTESLGLEPLNMRMPTNYGTQIPSLSLGTPALNAPGSSFMDAGYNPTAGLELDTPGLPEAQGGWFDMKGKGGMLLGSAQVGLGAYSAYNQEKQNDFMRGYYNNQMALQKTDFMNAAKTTNNELAAREGRRLSASQGLAYDSAANQAGRAEYMKNWGVKETF